MIEHQLVAARRLIASGNLDAAKAINQQILDRAPTHPVALLQAARIENLCGHYRLAQQLTLAAAKHPLHQPQDLKNLLHRLQVHHLREEIRLFVAAHPAETISHPALLDTVATTLNQINEPAAALRYLDRGLELAPRSTALLASRAQTFFFLGQFQQASRDISECLGLAPDMGFCWWLKSRLPQQTWEPGNFDQMCRLVSRGPTGSVDTVYAAYALHNALDAAGEYHAAATALEDACALRRPQVNYDEQEAESLFSALKQFDPKVPGGNDREGGVVPIFIVGMHRSGTTLLEQLLDAQPRVCGMGELYDFTAQMRFATNHPCRPIIDLTLIERSKGVDFAGVGTNYLQAVSLLHGDSDTHVIDKLPPNFLNIGFICEALPSARILHMTRDPIETCFSNLREPFSEHTATYSYDQTELGHYYLKYRQLMQHWHGRYPGRILDVDYGALTSDTERTLRQVSEFCGIAFDHSSVGLTRTPKAITTASAGQARDEVVVRDTPKWAPYERYLQKLTDALR